MTRRDYRIYPTKVDDRFGNTVTYSYVTAASGGLRITDIDASDGRHVHFTYNAGGQIASATAGTQQVDYGYSDGLLSSVTLPDESSWGYSTSAMVNLTRFVPLTAPTAFDDQFECQRRCRPTEAPQQRVKRRGRALAV